MAKCPLCGSDGDDLVFRFYCSNGECANFVPEKTKEKTEEWLAPKVDSPLFRIASIKRPLPTPPPSRIFSLPFNYAKEVQAEWSVKPDFELARERIFAGLGVPKRFFGHDDQRIPRFDLVYDSPAKQLRLTWLDLVPSALNVFVEPILEECLGMPMNGGAQRAIGDAVARCLLRMCDRGELVWNEFRGRWELHFTE